ncbi:MAG: DUF2231 domain-containing protein [Thermodesulfobacteriota bacterium]
MGKFEVCIKGTNFRIKTDKKVKTKNFHAARAVEANNPSEAVQKVMAGLREELGESVANSPSEPPSVDVVEVSEVYYFQDNMVVENLENKVLPCEGFDWQELEEQPEVLGNPMRPLEGKLPSLRVRLKNKDIHYHSLLIHFTNGLYPVAIFFMLLALLTGKDSFRQTYFYIITLATLSVPFSYLTGILQWKKKFQSMMIEIFYTKLRYGLLVFILGAIATIWNYFSPEILAKGSLLRVVFVLLNLAILPPLIYLGHLGGIIVYEGVET